jgi:enoyl-CoA hydratase
MVDAAQPVLIERPEPGVAVLRLNRPERSNAMDMDAVAQLHQAIESVSSDDAVRVVVLTGLGNAFCAGLDLKSMLDDRGALRPSAAGGYDLQERYEGTIRRLRASNKTIIAAVNGAAVGFGFALTLGADIRIASTSASFHVGAVRIGLTAGECGISYHLPRMVGASRAFEIMLTGRPIDAAEAQRIGLVARVVEPAQLLSDALDCARQVLLNSPFSTRHTKRVMWANLDAGSLDAALELENRAQVLGLQNADFAEAARAFVKKRVPKVKGG